MRAVKNQYVTPLVTVFDDGKRLHAVVTAAFMASFDGRLGEDVDLWSLAGEQIEGGVLDEGKPKPRGELMVHGSCYAHAPDTKSSFVSVKMAGREKKLAVFGPRTFGAAGPSAPKPFASVPIRFTHAFGGPDFADNPVGIGHRGTIAPQVEVLSSLVRTPDDTPPVAGFGRVDPTRPRRMKRMGTYDAKWLKTRYPGVSEDFDPRYFMNALEDQWLEGFFEGSEAFTVMNMHPEKATLEGRLPGVTARVLVRRKGEDFVDVPLRIETVHLFPAQERIGILCRGTTATKSDTLSDVLDVIAGLEWIGRPKPAAHYVEQYEKRTDKRRGAYVSLDNSSLLPEDAPVMPGTVGEEMKRLMPENLKRKRAERHAQSEFASMREQMEKSGVDMSKVPERLPDVQPLTEADLMQGPAPRVDPDELKKKLEAEHDRIMGLVKETAEARGKDFGEIEKQMKAGRVGPPKFDPAAERAKIARVAESLDEKKFDKDLFRERLQSEAFDRKLAELSAFLRESYRKMVHFQGVAPALEDSAEVRAFVARRMAEGGDLAETDLTGADLSNMDLAGADLRRAYMESVNLTGARLDRANLEYAVLARAALPGADLKSAKLKGVNASEADLSGADLSGQDLEGAFLVKTNLAGAKLVGCKLDKVNLSGARLEKTSLEKTTAKEIRITKTKLDGVSLQKASWHQCTLVECDLTRVDGAHASLTQLGLVDCKLEDCDFHDAVLKILSTGKIERGTSFARCSFVGADLFKAHMRNTVVDACDFTHASIREADFSEAVADGSVFEDARGVGARFMSASIRRCRFQRADLMEGLLGGAQMDDASFESANLYRADFGRTGGERVHMKGANVKRVRTVPKREGDA